MYCQNQLYRFLFKYKLTHKFNYKNSSKLPEFDKIVLNFGCKTSESVKLASSSLALKLMTDKEGILTVSKKAHVILTLKRGTPTGCKQVLNKHSKSFFFIRRFIQYILPRIKTFSGFDLKKTVQLQSFFYLVEDCYVFPAGNT